MKASPDHRSPLRPVAIVVLAVACAAIATVGGCVARSAPSGDTLLRLDPSAPRSRKVPASLPASTSALTSRSTPKAEVAPAGLEASSGLVFSAANAMTHVRYLSDVLGVRVGGGLAERKAADYVVRQLKSLGYEPRVQEVDLPNGRVSRNVIATKRGASPRVMVLGAHLDSKPPAPGANDAASGVGALLAMASELAGRQIPATVEFDFFGTEEIIGPDVSEHHFGSRRRVASMSAAEKKRVAGMISLDLIAVGDQLYARSMERGPQALVKDLLAFAKGRVPMTFKRDPGRTGMSDHEPYELAGIPAVWVESLPDDAYHTKNDVASHLDQARMQQVGQLVLDYVATRTEADLARLAR